MSSPVGRFRNGICSFPLLSLDFRKKKREKNTLEKFNIVTMLDHWLWEMNVSFWNRCSLLSLGIEASRSCQKVRQSSWSLWNLLLALSLKCEFSWQILLCRVSWVGFPTWRPKLSSGKPQNVWGNVTLNSELLKVVVNVIFINEWYLVDFCWHFCFVHHCCWAHSGLSVSLQRDDPFLAGKMWQKRIQSSGQFVKDKVFFLWQRS